MCQHQSNLWYVNGKKIQSMMGHRFLTTPISFHFGAGFFDECKRRYNIKLWKTFTDCFNCLPIAAIIDEKIFCCHGGLSPDLQDMEQIRRIVRPTDVPDTGLLCDLLWSDPDKEVKVSSQSDETHEPNAGRTFLYHCFGQHVSQITCL